MRIMELGEGVSDGQGRNDRLKAPRKLIDEILAKLGQGLQAIADEAPEHRKREEYEWLIAHRAQAMSSPNRELGLRRKSFNNTIRAKRWLGRGFPLGRSEGPREHGRALRV
jgi:hypothetical protein